MLVFWCSTLETKTVIFPIQHKNPTGPTYVICRNTRQIQQPSKKWSKRKGQKSHWETEKLKSEAQTFTSARECDDVCFTFFLCSSHLWLPLLLDPLPPHRNFSLLPQFSSLRLQKPSDYIQLRRFQLRHRRTRRRTRLHRQLAQWPCFLRPIYGSPLRWTPPHRFPLYVFIFSVYQWWFVPHYLRELRIV